MAFRWTRHTLPPPKCSHTLSLRQLPQPPLCHQLSKMLNLPTLRLATGLPIYPEISCRGRRWMERDIGKMGNRAHSHQQLTILPEMYLPYQKSKRLRWHTICHGRCQTNPEPGGAKGN